ncbi:hypothetical protein DL96DRAFT_1706315 [Flagelloscypha sp. PMI_526]|nr:hypothetical protein DL96DRAFT_1706315 [Flagelloscypha sp. PMI_526]
MSTKLPVVDNTIGAIEIGVIANAVLLGMVQIQCYNYYSRFQDDRKLLKALVAVVWVLDMAQAWTLFLPLYGLTVKGYGNPKLILDLPPSIFLTMSFGGTATALIQGFLAFRVYRLVNLLSFAILSWLLTLVRFAGCLSVTATGYNTASLPLYREQYGWLWDALLAIGIANDLLVTGGLTFSLYKSRKKGHVRTVLVIDKLIVWTLETTALTVIVNLLVIIFYHIFPKTYIWIGMYCLTPKFFTLSLLAILNGRASLRHQIDTAGQSSNTEGNSLPTRSQQTRLHIKMTRVQQSDYGPTALETNDIYPAHFKHEENIHDENFSTLFHNA